MCIPALLYWWSAVTWIKTKNRCVCIYIHTYIHMRIAFSNTRIFRWTNSVCAILDCPGDGCKLRLMRDACPKRLGHSSCQRLRYRIREWNRIAIVEKMRIPRQRLPTRQASGRELKTVSSSYGVDFSHAENVERGCSAMYQNGWCNSGPSRLNCPPRRKRTRFYGCNV